MDNTNINAGNWFIDQLNVYQSANSDSDSIKNNFIIRLAEFEIITNSLLDKKVNDPLQHELVLGRRGSGKSTLMKRIEIEILENNKLSKKYIAINLAEEQAGIYRLFDLWEQVIEELKHQLDIEIVIKDYAGFSNNQDYTRYLYQLIHELCAKHKKRIVLLLDNFDRIVENFSDDGNLLRETLINYSDIQIIAASTRMDEHFWRYDMPFYEFFRRHRLDALSREEIIKLLYHWSDVMQIAKLRTFVDNNPGKIENIRLLTDGLPRTLQFFIQMVLQNEAANSYDYLKKIMDNVTPLYQERLNSLPAQLKKTVLEMAFIWEASTTKQLVEKVKMESKLVSANLKTLVEKGIADKIETSKKNHLYRISERFFNMWLIITQGNPEQKRKAKWLSIFLENWYDASDLRTLAKQHIDNLKNNKISWDKALIFSKALSQSKYISLLERDKIIDLTEKIRDRKVKNCLIELPERFDDIMDKASILVEGGKIEEAITIVNNIENEEDGYKFVILGSLYSQIKDIMEAERVNLQGIEKGNVYAMYNIAVLYDEQGKYTEAEKYYLKAIGKGIVRALFNLALMYDNQEKFPEAEKYYMMAIEKGDEKVLNTLAFFYFRQKKYSEAERYYLMAIDKGNVKALSNLAVLYNDQKKYKEAEKYYLIAIEKGNVESLFNLALLYDNKEKFADAEKYYLIAIEKGNVESLHNLALLYYNQEKFEEAEKYYLLAIEKGNVESLYNLALLYHNQEKFADAEKYYLIAIEKGDVESLYNLALLYYNQEKFAEAEKYYLLVIEKGHAKAMNNIASYYYGQKRYREAEKYFLLAIEKGNVEAIFNLALFYNNQDKFVEAEKYYLMAIEMGEVMAMINLAILYISQGKFVEAEGYYLMAIEKGDKRAINNLARFYYERNSNKEKALEYLNRANETETQILVQQNLLVVEIWNGIFNNVENRIITIINESKGDDLNEFFVDLLIHQQKNLILRLFSNPEFDQMLQEKYTVLYYVSLLLNKSQDENLALRIPPELQSTIDDVMLKIKERAEFYGYNL